MDTVASAVFPLAGAASRQVCLAFRLTPGRAPCQTRPAIDCVIRRKPGDAAAETARSVARPAGYSRGGRAAGDLGHQIEHAEREPGVRRQL